MPPEAAPPTDLSIAEQHRRLDAMFEEVLAALREGETAEAIRGAFARLREALEAHVDQEDRLYHPSLRALQPGHHAVLDAITEAHGDIRRRLEQIDARLGARAFDDVARDLSAFAEDFAEHEATEEELLKRIDEGIRGA